MAKCMFIGHRDAELTSMQEEKLKGIVEKLIVDNNVTTFYFSEVGDFDAIAKMVVDEMKEKYPYIKRIFVCGKYQNAGERYYKWKLEHYEECYVPEEAIGAKRNTHIKTNEHMINNSNYVVAYYNKSYYLAKTKSGTRIALDYAHQKRKMIINIFE